MENRKNMLFEIKLVSVALVLLFIVAGLTAFYFHALKESDQEGYYITKEAKCDGTDLTDKNVRDVIGVNRLSQVMNIYLKDTGDCGVYLFSQTTASVWKEDEEGNISIPYGDNDLTLERTLSGYKLTGIHEGREFDIVLEKAEKVPKVFQKHPELTFGVNYTKADTLALCNFMQEGRFLVKKDRLYGKFFSGSDCTLGYGTINEESGKVTVGNIKTLEKGGQAKFLNMDENCVYYLWAPSDGSIESIRRVDIKSGKSKVIREGNIDYLQLRYNRLYFADENYRFHEMKLDGSNDEIIVDKEIYMPYVIDKDWLIYQDDKDGERLHLRKLGSEYDRVISTERTYAWTIKNRTLYYTSTSDKEDENKHRCKLHKVKLDSLKKGETADSIEVEASEKYMGDSFAIDGKLLFGGDGSSENLSAWKNYSNDLYKRNDQNSYLAFLNGKFVIREKMTKNGSHVQFVMKSIKTQKESVF